MKFPNLKLSEVIVFLKDKNKKENGLMLDFDSSGSLNVGTEGAYGSRSAYNTCRISFEQAKILKDYLNEHLE